MVKPAGKNSGFQNSLVISCHHKLDESLWAQAKRFLEFGYPKLLLNVVAENINRRGRANVRDQAAVTRAAKVSVVPYMLAISHNLRSIAKKNWCGCSFF